jgi:MoaA/NifB/PqqE/SkfB family radical SAM enzyme
MTEIALSRLTPLGGGNLTPRSGAVELVTDPRPWSHSAEAEFEFPQIDSAAQKLMVTLQVESGSVGVGWLSQDGTAWIDHASARGNARPILEIPAGTAGGKLIFNNQRNDGNPSRVTIEKINIIEPTEDYYSAGLAAEERGDIAAAMAHYKAVLADDPAHVSAIAALGRLRYVDPPQPVIEEMRRWRPQDAVFEVMIEIRNPCNYRCHYCIAAGHNNTPVQYFDLERIERVYSQIHSRLIITSLECGGGEPTVHPQFPELLRIISKYGHVSFPSNNSQNPRRWLPLETAKRIQIRSALHPEAEENLQRYCDNARYLIDAGVDFGSLFIAHPQRIDKFHQLREFLQQRGVPLIPLPFGGIYEEKTYPHAYTEEQRDLMGLNEPTTYWLSRIDPHVTRIRNFRGIPCTAGQRSLYIKSDGTVLRCMFDQERILDGPLPEADICGVRSCGCSLKLEKLNQVDLDADTWLQSCGPRVDLDGSAYDWIGPMTENVNHLIAAHGYDGWNGALTVEAMRIYDALMAAYGKNEFAE